MAKLGMLGLGTLGVVAAGWSGGWYYGESQIRAQTEAQIVEWAAQGTAVSYKAMEIEGFPFAYRGKLVEPRSQSMVQTFQGLAVAEWKTPLIAFDAAVSDIGTVNFSIPDEQKVRISPVEEGLPPFDVVIRSNGFAGSLSQGGGQVSANGDGEDIVVEVMPSGASPYVVTMQKLSIAAAAPLEAAGQINAVVDLEGAAVNGDAWDILDPSQSFPRDPANVRLNATADTSLRPDRTLQVNAIKIDRVALDLAGVSLDGDGAATVQDRTPDGTITLRLQGLGGFLGNAVRAGFIPEEQASTYESALSLFAKKGEREGEQVYTVSFGGGYMYVNGVPTFIPTPQLP